MKILDIIIICFVAVWFICAIVYICIRKKKGKSSCGCDTCSGDCLHCGKDKGDIEK